MWRKLLLFAEQVWLYFGMIGGFMFIVIQLILIIDFAHSWAEAWVGNYEESGSKGWLVALIGTSLVTFGITLAVIVLNYVYYTGEYTGKAGLFSNYFELRCCCTFETYASYDFRNLILASLVVKDFLLQDSASCTNSSSPSTCFSVSV